MAFLWWRWWWRAVTVFTTATLTSGVSGGEGSGSSGDDGSSGGGSSSNSSVWRDVSVTLLALALCGFLVRRVLRRTPRVTTRDTTRGHRWCHTSVFSQPSYCSVCQCLLMTCRGAFCESCGVCSCGSCVARADRQLSCKPISIGGGGGNSSQPALKHHWVQGNLPFDSMCEVCDERCGDAPQLSDQRCCLCQRTVHTHCQQNMGQLCDLGRFAAFVVAPNQVVARAVRTVRGRQLVVAAVTPPSVGNQQKHWTPLIVIGNRLAGSNEGEQVLMAFRRYLNPAQVIDLSEQSVEDAVQWCRLLQRHSAATACRVLAAGGDGTVVSVLNAIDQLQLQQQLEEQQQQLEKEQQHQQQQHKQQDPKGQQQRRRGRLEVAVGVVPLGTGNDLSRELGSGAALASAPNLSLAATLMQRLTTARLVNIDRWMVRFDMAPSVPLPLPGALSSSLSSSALMTNYLSVGVDALVTLNFHRTRQSPLATAGGGLWSGRLLNKLIYLCHGTRDVLERECQQLQRRLQLWLDGRLVQLPAVEAVVVLNIGSWGAGVRPWLLGQGPGEFGEQKLDDGLLEVFCVYSSFHIAQMQVGLSEPLRIGQARSVKIKLDAKTPMQMDGEPWEQTPCTITISHHNQARMIQMPSPL